MIDQMIHASCRCGQTGGAGIQIWSMSSGVTESESAELSLWVDYRWPAASGAQDVPTLPTAFGYGVLASGRHAVFQVRPVARDHGGRPGSAVAHAFIFDDAALPEFTSGVDYWESPDFREQLTDDEVQSTSPPPPLPQLEAQHLRVGAPAEEWRRSLSDFIRNLEPAGAIEFLAPYAGRHDEVLVVVEETPIFMQSLLLLEKLLGRPHSFLTYASETPFALAIDTLPFEVVCGEVLSRRVIEAWRKRARPFSWRSLQHGCGHVPSRLTTLIETFIAKGGDLPHYAYCAPGDGLKILLAIDPLLPVGDGPPDPTAAEIEHAFRLAVKRGRGALRRLVLDSLERMGTGPLAEVDLPVQANFLSGLGEPESKTAARLLCRLCTPRANSAVLAMLGTWSRALTSTSALDAFEETDQAEPARSKQARALRVGCGIALGRKPVLEDLLALDSPELRAVFQLLSHAKNGTLFEALEEAGRPDDQVAAALRRWTVLKKSAKAAVEWLVEAPVSVPGLRADIFREVLTEVTVDAEIFAKMLKRPDLKNPEDLISAARHGAKNCRIGHIRKAVDRAKVARDEQITQAALDLAEDRLLDEFQAVQLDDDFGPLLGAIRYVYREGEDYRRKDGGRGWPKLGCLLEMSNLVRAPNLERKPPPAQAIETLKSLDEEEQEKALQFLTYQLMANPIVDNPTSGRLRLERLERSLWLLEEFTDKDWSGDVYAPLCMDARDIAILIAWRCRRDMAERVKHFVTKTTLAEAVTTDATRKIIRTELKNIERFDRVEETMEWFWFELGFRKR